MEALTSWVVMRIWSPDLRTLPSRMVATRSFWPISPTSSFFPLKAKADVRAATRRPETLERRFKSSSERPSEKYSCSLSELMLTSGSTAMDGPASAAGATAAGRPRMRK